MEKIKDKNEKPEICGVCGSRDHITNEVNDRITDAWFCTKCGSLLGWIKEDKNDR